MEAFKAYIKKEYPHIDSGDKMFAWDIWRASLKWVKKTHDLCNRTGEWEGDKIEKELEVSPSET